MNVTMKQNEPVRGQKIWHHDAANNRYGIYIEPRERGGAVIIWLNNDEKLIEKRNHYFLIEAPNMTYLNEILEEKKIERLIEIAEWNQVHNKEYQKQRHFEAIKEFEAYRNLWE